jgi:hypothetical protein
MLQPLKTVNSSVAYFAEFRQLALVSQKIGLRSLSKLKSAHGRWYMGIHNEQSHFDLVLGTKDMTVPTPRGIPVNHVPKGAWASFSMACEGQVQQVIECG